MAATKKGGTVRKAAKPAAKSKASGSKTVKAASKQADPKSRAEAQPKGDARVKAPSRAAKPKAESNGKPKTAAKKPAAVKLTPKQAELLGRVHGVGEGGFEPSKAEARAIEPLLAKKVVKRGAKNKATGQFRYLVTKTGQKHLPGPAVAPAAPTASSAQAPSPSPGA
jgi:hypothetical protein